MKNISRIQNVSLPVIITLVVIIGFSMIACDTGTGTTSNPFEGTWTGYDTAQDSVRFVVGPSNWAISWFDYSGSLEGTYVHTGNSATLYDTRGLNIGTATISGNTLTLFISSTTNDYLNGVVLRK